MKFRIIGANRDTGEDVKMVIDAMDQNAAEQWATENGIMWSTVEPQGGGIPVATATSKPVVAEPISVVRGPLGNSSTVNIPGPHSGVTVVNQNITAPNKSVSGFGVAALVMGILAALICWIPFLGILSIPVAGIGLLLGAVGIMVSLVGKKSGVGMPFAGAFICILAIVIAFVITGSAAKSISDTLADAAKRRNATNQQIVVDVAHDTTARQQTTRPNIAPAAAPLSTENPAPSPAEIEWAPADKAVKQGNVEVKLTSVEVGKVLIQKFGGETGTSKEDQLMITVEVTNLSDTKKLDFHTFAGRDYSFGENDSASLADDFGNTYKRVNFGITSPPVGRTNSDSLYPGKSISDIIVFEVPIEKAKSLDLILPAASFQGSGVLRIRIPATMIKKP